MTAVFSNHRCIVYMFESEFLLGNTMKDVIVFYSVYKSPHTGGPRCFTGNNLKHLLQFWKVLKNLSYTCPPLYYVNPIDIFAKFNFKFNEPNDMTA